MCFLKYAYGKRLNILKWNKKGVEGATWQWQSVDWEKRRNSVSFVGYSQVLSDKMLRTLKSTASVAYSVDAIFLSVSDLRRQPLKDNGHTLVGLLPARCNQVQQKDEGEAGDVEMFV